MNTRGLIVWRSKTALFFAILLIGCALRLGNGVARYQDSFSRTGADFITLWQSDALEHVLIAKSLIEDGAYRVGHSPPELEGRYARWGDSDALFKAPLYQYFLAAVFAVSGFSFALFLPLQALIGGIASGFAALAALELFHRWRIAAFSGLAAAGALDWSCPHDAPSREGQQHPTSAPLGAAPPLEGRSPQGTAPAAPERRGSAPAVAPPRPTVTAAP